MTTKPARGAEPGDDGLGGLSDPRPWRVVLHDDPDTPVSFVARVLTSRFGLEMGDAAPIILGMSRSGRGVAGVFTRGYAMTKADVVVREARENGHPLRVTAEPVEGWED